jgi:TonB family protein
MNRPFHKNPWLPFIASFLLHGVLFLPPFNFSFSDLKKIDLFAPPVAVIKFQFFAPVPQLPSEPKPETAVRQSDPDGIPAEKEEAEAPDDLKELIESIEGRQKSNAIKTLVPQEPPDRDKIRWDYALFIQNAVRKNLVYPEPQKAMGRHESVRVIFCISKDGTLIGRPDIPEIYRSRHDDFNRAAVEAVLKASDTFPPLPEELGKDRQNFDIVIDFEP